MQRRQFLKSSGCSFAFSVAGTQFLLSPKEAYAKNADFTVLSQQESETLAALAEGLVPGAEKAGVAYFVDSQLAVDFADSLLMIRYLGVSAPLRNFYQICLANIHKATRQKFDKPLPQLSQDQCEQLGIDMAQDELPDWQGPPASFFYFVLRSDAVDMVYGMQQGFETLDIPTMQHIVPSKWW